MGITYNTARKCLVFWTLFIGIGAVAGGLSMIIDPSGKALHMDGMLPFFQVLPFANVLFQDFLFSGFALLIVNGLTNLTAAILLLKKKKSILCRQHCRLPKKGCPFIWINPAGTILTNSCN